MTTPAETVAGNNEEIKVDPAADTAKTETVALDAKETAKADDTQKASAGTDDAAWAIETHTKVGNEVVATLKSTGISLADATELLGPVIQSGDFSKLDKAALSAKIGDAQASIVMSGIQQHLAAHATNVAAVQTAIHTAVGGQPNWDKVRGWAKETINEAELGEYRAMIDKGGRFATMAAEDLKTRYESAGNTALDGGASQIVPGAGQDNAQVKDLSRADMVLEMRKLDRKGQLTADARRALHARRKD